MKSSSRKLAFGRKRAVSSERQTKYKASWFERGGKKMSAPRSHKKVGWA